MRATTSVATVCKRLVVFAERLRAISCASYKLTISEEYEVKMKLRELYHALIESVKRQRCKGTVGHNINVLEDYCTVIRIAVQKTERF